ncbi:NAD-dependent protein deacylase [Streptococcus constellatus subsp. pharyngis]|uniref:NAD-dependent protein deacetylase n=1 Tax=Streptococcus constellatus subsp. pharyngis SK1060 = CCUG 46377 TaxID=1035184 RepID=F9P6C0_STRCV|nr:MULTISPECIES: NAD-dependent protein deacylase [Streptococcus]AGU72748.1 NAD-dependent deacetylase [Streptococcus constellatus subsp. pharyngis C232]AGU74504.1 NAD-dependent deacetylase [Streptococcus constellatus subsp. pharyngis C818]AGU79921.1 NAD-dependent deacetylase [Streptococcus constellatus subsp. pharyngis C1050]EGV09369.1 transcriptional regulator, Sir2 family [Streptococcus constellatus subsp. pharyngis SK1060 = CCUG 46377]QRP82177.1 NAD-dependent protein deacylase [Streptococcus
MDKIEELAYIIQSSQNIVFFGGAGVSTESGIPDFRSSNGIYNIELNQHFTAEQLVSHTMFERYPEQFFDFYKKYLIYPDARPNVAHDYLVHLEKTGKLKAIVTQNIDSLHEIAGSKNVLKIHGSVDRNYCTNCHRFYDLEDFLRLSGTIPYCETCGYIVKPDVTLYEESLNMDVFSQAIQAISRADLLIIGGTSLVVYPAANLVHYFQGRQLVLINKSNTVQDNQADLVIKGKIGEVLSKVWKAEE